MKPAPPVIMTLRGRKSSSPGTNAEKGILSVQHPSEPILIISIFLLEPVKEAIVNRCFENGREEIKEDSLMNCRSTANGKWEGSIVGLCQNELWVTLCLFASLSRGPVGKRQFSAWVLASSSLNISQRASPATAFLSYSAHRL